MPLTPLLPETTGPFELEVTVFPALRADGVLLDPADGHWLVVCDDPAELRADLGPESVLEVAPLYDMGDPSRRTVRLVGHRNDEGRTFGP